MTNFTVTTVIPGSPEDQKIQDELASQKQAERERLTRMAEEAKRKREADQAAYSAALAKRMKELADVERQMKIERQQQNENMRRIEAGELKPFEIDGRPIHRVDFFEMPDGNVKVSKIHRNENSREDFTITVEMKPVDLAEARKWLVENGYIVRQWPGGMRAWFGRLWPIRSKSTIIKMRDSARDARSHGTNSVDTTTVDYAYDM